MVAVRDGHRTVVRVARRSTCLHDAPMGRLLAICGWLAWQIRRPVGARLARLAPAVVAAILVVVALVPIVVPLLEAQPEDTTVQAIFDRATTHPDGWVRLTGRMVPLSQTPTGEDGAHALLVDAANPLRAVVVRARSAVAATERTTVTGRLEPTSVVVSEELPIEATVAGTPPRIVPDRLLVLDAAPQPPRPVLWYLAIPPLLVAAMIVIGIRSGYPIFRPTASIDVLVRPLAPGERIPTAFGGRIGPNRADLADPAGALLLVRRDGRTNLLTAQPLGDGNGPAPKPVLVGGGWTQGRIGSVHTASETVAALHVRSELVDAIFLFARDAERDRVAALVAVER